MRLRILIICLTFWVSLNIWIRQTSWKYLYVHYINIWHHLRQSVNISLLSQYKSEIICYFHQMKFYETLIEIVMEISVYIFILYILYVDLVLGLRLGDMGVCLNSNHKLMWVVSIYFYILFIFEVPLVTFMEKN